MLSEKSSLRFFIGVCVVFFVAKDVNGLKISIYYEALCPDSVRFIGKQLYANWDKIGSYVDQVEFVPYGKALHWISNLNPLQYQFTCQHGPQECQGNKYHACALAQNKGNKVNVPLVYCLMKNMNSYQFPVVEQCATMFGLNMTQLQTCANTPEGQILLKNYGDKTWMKVPNISFVPTIVFDDKFDRTTHDNAIADLVAVVCSKIVDRPSFCDGKRY